MVHIPDCVSGRTLFWFWLHFVTPKQSNAARDNFWRFVLSAELIVQYRQCISDGSDIDDRTLESTRKQLKKYNQTLRTRSQMLRAESRLYVGKGRLLREHSNKLIQKDQLP